MDPLLKDYARQRRQDYGVPKSIPAQRRAELLAEVDKTLGRSPSTLVQPSPPRQDWGVRWSEMGRVWWSRIVWGMGTVGVLVFLAVLLRDTDPTARAPESSALGTSKAADQPEGQSSILSEDKERDLDPAIPATKKTVRDLEKTLRAGSTSTELPAPAPALEESAARAAAAPPSPVEPSAIPVQSLNSESRAALTKQLISEIKSKKVAETSNTSTPAPSPPPSVTKAVPEVGRQSTFENGQQRFVRLEWGYRRNMNSPPLPRVLQNFLVEMRGGEMRVVDEDGSVFTGSLAAESRSSTGELRQTFRVEGRSQALGAPVEFSGEVVGSTNSVRLQGRVKIDGRQQFPISAQPLQP
ncbi:MAG: hypothetical protein FJ404_07980 [Verrucomicrobia bacterium]|nr:hypothetical protein [Verrucomicrobiota bacterium]